MSTQTAQLSARAYSETLELKGWVDRADMLASQGSELMLLRVEQFGVPRNIGDKKASVAILGINASLFDIMPSELHAHSEIRTSSLRQGRPRNRSL